MEKMKLVILGGGLAGLPLALLIEKDKRLTERLDVVMIDQRDYFEMNCESVRFLVKPDIHHKFVAPYSSYLRTTNFLCAKIRSVHDKYVEIMREGIIEHVPYDYLVVALGTKYPFFKASAQTIPQRMEELSDFAYRLGVAQRVLVVGGRTVGVEFIGEVLAEYPDKEVIVVHSGPNLLDEFKQSGVDLLNHYVKQKRLTIILEKKVVSSEGTLHTLSDGTVIEADLKVVATGMVPNSEPLLPFLEDALSKSKCLKVLPTLQVEGHANVFSIGDITDLKIPKLAANIRKQKKVIARNLRSLVLGKPLVYLADSKLQTISLVSVGPSYAIMSLPVTKGVVTYVGNSLVSYAKTRMFIRLTKCPSLL